MDVVNFRMLKENMWGGGGEYSKPLALAITLNHLFSLLPFGGNFFISSYLFETVML